MADTAKTRCLVPGECAGPVEWSDQAVSLARIDPCTGILHEPGHPLDQHSLAGKLLVCPGGKGSSSGSYVLLNLARQGLAPGAIVVEQADAVIIAGAVLAGVPLVQGIDIAPLRTAAHHRVSSQSAGATTSMTLTADERAMLDGQRGRGRQLAMRILVAVGDACSADRMIPVASTHVGLSLSSLGEAGVLMLESLAAEGLRVAVPTTTNVLSFQRNDRGTHDAILQRRALDALLALGASANCSCNPFVQGHVPRLGQAVAWSESATAPFVNGALGAHTNREGATALASALTGLTPRYGMHVQQERLAGPLFRITAALDSAAHFHLLGAAIGRRTGTAVPALIGMPGTTTRDALFAFSASLAAHSTAAIFHAVGITPEAPDLQTLYPNGAPEPILIGESELRAEQARWPDDGQRPDYIILGCPHASLQQLEELAGLVQTRALPTRVAFLVHTNRDVLQAATGSGVLEVLRHAGVRVTTDTCAYVSLEAYPPGARVLTDSAKMAFLLSTRGLQPSVLASRDCVRAAFG